MTRARRGRPIDLSGQAARKHTTFLCRLMEEARVALEADRSSTPRARLPVASQFGRVRAHPPMVQPELRRLGTRAPTDRLAATTARGTTGVTRLAPAAPPASRSRVSPCARGLQPRAGCSRGVGRLGPYHAATETFVYPDQRLAWIDNKKAGSSTLGPAQRVPQERLRRAAGALSVRRRDAGRAPPLLPNTRCSSARLRFTSGAGEAHCLCRARPCRALLLRAGDGGPLGDAPTTLPARACCAACGAPVRRRRRPRRQAPRLETQSLAQHARDWRHHAGTGWRSRGRVVPLDFIGRIEHLADDLLELVDLAGFIHQRLLSRRQAARTRGTLRGGRWQRWTTT